MHHLPAYGYKGRVSLLRSIAHCPPTNHKSMAEPMKRRPNKEQPVSTKAQKLLRLFHVDSNYPIGTRICWLLPIVDIINLTKTCKAFSKLYRSLISSQWNVEWRLARFVSDVTSFRCQMARTNALISGSFALQFFDRVCWPASDLDINIRQGSDTFESYLCRVEGYTLQRSTDGDRYKMIGVDKVLFLHCRFNVGMGLSTVAGLAFCRT